MDFPKWTFLKSAISTVKKSSPIYLFLSAKLIVIEAKKQLIKQFNNLYQLLNQKKNLDSKFEVHEFMAIGLS